MGIGELLGLAASISLLSGWRVYLCVFAIGVAMRLGWVALPDHVHTLDALANPWVIGIAGVGLVAELFADKVPWLDSLWDAIHTAIRPVGGALLALAIIDPADPAWQLASLLLGGSAALIGHGAKAGTRALINTSPEPVTNIAASTGEDIASLSLIALAIANPIVAGVIAVLLLAACIATIVVLRRTLARILQPARDEAPP